MVPDLLEFERQAHRHGFRCIAGIDEAGRGPLAGPVVAAAVILPTAFDAPGLTDSKKLTPRKRDAWYDWIQECAVAVGVGLVEAGEIDRINILNASLRAMAMAVARLVPAPDCLFIDGIWTIASDLPQTPIVKGDARSLSIAAASVIAKVTRDRIMCDHHEKFPEFGFDRHKGYPTRDHKAAIRQFGPCPIHRKTFRGVREVSEAGATE